jgi:F-type H+-transporting ATPase subunit b
MFHIESLLKGLTLMLNFYVPTFVLVAINLLILYAIMKRILFKPVTQFMENRTRTIRDSLDQADRAKAEAADMRGQLEEQLKTARDEAARIVEDARARGSREYAAILASAKVDAETLLTRTREEMERERDTMLRDIRGQVAGLALAAASKVIEANMDTESNRNLVNKFIDEAGAA